jgi:hypothetical protein
MANQSKTHLWLNTFIALVASAGSSYFASQTYFLKTESIGLIPSETFDCKAEFHKEGDGGSLGLCWIVTLTNQSDTRASVVSGTVREVAKAGLVYRSGFTEFEDTKGQALTFPIVLDGGEARSYLVRVPVQVTKAVAEVIAKALAAKPEQSLKELQYQTFAKQLDLVGNEVNAHDTGSGWITIWSLPMNQGTTFAQVEVSTGRGRSFQTQMRYPPFIALNERNPDQNH